MPHRAERAHDDDEGDAPVLRLGVGESQQAKFAEGVASVLRDGVPQVVLVAHAFAESLEIGILEVVGLDALLHARCDKAVGGQRLAVYEVVVGASEGAGGHGGERLPVAQGVDQVDAVTQHPRPDLGGSEPAQTPLERGPAQRPDDFENSGRVLRVVDQFVEGSQGDADTHTL